MGTWLAEHALAAAITVIAGVIATFLSKKVGSILDSVEAKNNIDIDDKLEQRIQNIIRKVVIAIGQTFVSGLKEKGKFDDEAKKRALRDAVEESGRVILEEIGVRKDNNAITLAVEAELGEKKEIARIMGGANEAKRFVRKKKRKKTRRRT